jgi:hypothetical protein
MTKGNEDRPPHDGKEQPMQDGVRTWVMVGLTFIFVTLYVAALVGLIHSPAVADQQTVTRLESIVFVIIGYYFGRLPAQATEKTLKGEIQRQTEKADTAEERKGAAQQTAQALEEKIKNTKAVLGSGAPREGISSDGLAVSLGKTSTNADALRQCVIAAARVLES